MSLPINAQFQLGLKPVVGLNFNLHTGSDFPESDNGFGLVIGEQADMSFSKSIGLIAGLAFYDNRSGSYSSTASQNGIAYTSDISASLAYF